MGSDNGLVGRPGILQHVDCQGPQGRAVRALWNCLFCVTEYTNVGGLPKPVIRRYDSTAIQRL